MDDLISAGVVGDRRHRSGHSESGLGQVERESTASVSAGFDKTNVCQKSSHPRLRLVGVRALEPIGIPLLPLIPPHGLAVVARVWDIRDSKCLADPLSRGADPVLAIDVSRPVSGPNRIGLP